MELSSISIAITSLVGALFSPGAMFTTGINGAWYDPSDFSTMFQDAAGTTPVTAVGQPVGLMLDKSKGLVIGSDVVVNGGFNTDTNWTKGSGWTIGGGVASSSGATSFIQSTVAPLTIGKWYIATFTVTAYSSGRVSHPYDGFNVTYAPNSPGTYTRCFYAASATLYVYSEAFVGSIDNISVRELPGNHAFNGSGNSANFPVLSARYNLLTKTEQFDDAVWAKANVTVTANATIAPDGTNTAIKLVEATGSGFKFAQQNVTSSEVSTLYFYVKAAGRTACFLGNSPNNPTYFDLSNGTVSQLGTGWTSANIISVGNGWYLCSVTSPKQSWVVAQVGPAVGTNGSYTGDGTSGIYIWHPDLRVANDALNQPAYQRVNTATDYDTVGFKPYLSFNGVNQWLQTNSIDFTYGDKMFVSAGVRKLGDALPATLAELSTNSSLNAGTFLFKAPQVTITGAYGFWSSGSLLGNALATGGSAAPITNVVSGIGNISGDQAMLRINGSQASSSSGDQGSGNYGNYALYIGASAGTSLFFNGRLYGLVIAGKQASASEIASTEAWLNQKTGAY